MHGYTCRILNPRPAISRKRAQPAAAIRELAYPSINRRAHSITIQGREAGMKQSVYDLINPFFAGIRRTVPIVNPVGGAPIFLGQHPPVLLQGARRSSTVGNAQQFLPADRFDVSRLLRARIFRHHPADRARRRRTRGYRDRMEPAPGGNARRRGARGPSAGNPDRRVLSA